MISLILAYQLTCSDVQWFISGVNGTDLSQKEKSELIIEFMSHMPDDCTIDRDARRS